MLPVVLVKYYRENQYIYIYIYIYKDIFSTSILYIVLKFLPQYNTYYLLYTCIVEKRGGYDKTNRSRSAPLRSTVGLVQVYV